MDLSKIISISGTSGLFKVVAQGKSGLIVESFADKKRFPVHTHQKVSVLENISIYLNTNETLPLKDVLKKIYEKESGNAASDSKMADDDLKKYFETVLPEYDREKVHTSDIRKIIFWYNMLRTTDIFTQKEEEKTTDAPILPEEGGKKPEHHFTHESQGKHVNTNMNAPKKTVGVRKVGTA